MASFHTKNSSTSKQLEELLSNFELTSNNTQKILEKKTSTDILNDALDKFNNRKNVPTNKTPNQVTQNHNLKNQIHPSNLNDSVNPNKKSEEFDPKKIQLKNPSSIFAVLGEKAVRPFYETTNEVYWDKYDTFVSTHAIPVGEKKILGALSLGPVPKSWVPRTKQRGPFLGNNNKWTSVPRALGIPGAKFIGRLSVPIVVGTAIAIGSYNSCVAIYGYFHAK